MKTVSVNIVMTYPVHWTRYQVLRDFVQNFYDSIGAGDWYRSFHYSFNDSVLSMWVENSSFSYEWLMHIGASTKTNNSNEYAGFFGEGFKIASLCAIRDFGWEVEMYSDDWRIEVTEIDQVIDHTHVKMLAYNISTVKKTRETKLIIKNISDVDCRLFQVIPDSFYSPDNPIMGKSLWQGPAGAIFLRSNKPINESLPITSEYGRRGAVFCGYQMIGTNPFDLVICLHKYSKEDRERRSLYSFEVIDVFEDICQYIDSECAMIMLEKMRKYWNTYPHKRVDIHSWSWTVDMLIRKMTYSYGVKHAFAARYGNLLCLKRVYSIGEKNRRWQARSWLNQQDKKYILVKDTFRLLGYPTLEEECEKQGGFVVDDNADAIQEKCFAVLEDVCKDIFQDFFIVDSLPERKIITNTRAAYHGMATTYKKRTPLMNTKGMRIGYEIGKVYLKSDIFREEGYFDGLSTYVHEMCHMFGGDSSSSFSLALTYAIELLMGNQDKVLLGKRMWEALFCNDFDFGNVS